MNLLKGIFVLALFISVSCEEEDLESDVTTVEFSTHHTEKPIENAVNASIVTPDEIEPPVSYEKEQQRLAALKFVEEIRGMENPFNSTEHSHEEQTNTSTNATIDIKNKIKVECLPRTIPENETAKVMLSNSSTLLKVLSTSTKNTSAGECVVVLFFSRQCIFSARMAPHYNALPRVFPDIAFHAVDIMETGNLYIRYGLVYVPNIMLFHNSKPHARFNETTMNLDQLVKFINKFTGLEHNGTLNVTSADMTGPVPSTIVKRVDYMLVLSWAFTLCCFFIGFVKSSICKRMVEFLRNTWHEANAAHAAQHEHED